jgi:predicted permease
MGGVIILLLFLVVGFFSKESGLVHKRHSALLNKVIIYFFIPLITLLNIPELELSIGLLWLSISPFLVFFFGWIYFSIAGKQMKFETESTQALILTGGISSTSFVGFPIFESLYGDLGLSYGVLLSMGGTILVFNTVGMGLLFKYSNNALSFTKVMKRILTFFPFLIFVLALALNLINVTLPILAKEIISLLVSPFSAVALLAIGMQVELKSFKNLKRELIVGQSYKLLVAPIIIYLTGRLFYEPSNLIFQIAVLGSAIGSMNAIAFMTADKNIKPNLAIAMPAIGIPLSILSLFVIYFIIN